MSTASASRTRASRRARPGGLARTGGAGERVRWDRLGALALLCVLVALAYLYASAGLHMLSTLHQSRHDNATVAAMEREHRALLRQHQSLSGQAALEAHARKLGMMRKGEQPYVVGNLPSN
jgi:cell division protein FtsB